MVYIPIVNQSMAAQGPVLFKFLTSNKMASKKSYKDSEEYRANTKAMREATRAMNNLAKSVTARTCADPLGSCLAIDRLLESPAAAGIPESRRHGLAEAAENFRSEMAAAGMQTMMAAMADGQGHGEGKYGDGDQSEVSGREANILTIRWGNNH